MSTEILHHFLRIYKFFYIDSRRCDFCYDNLSSILSESIESLNEYFSWILKLHLCSGEKALSAEIIDATKLQSLPPETIKMLDILWKRKPEDILYYIDLNFDSFLKYKLKLFFLVVLEEVNKSYFLYKYADNFPDPLIQEMLFFYYYAFYWDGGSDIQTSISYTDKLIERYPDFISFRLFKIRQTFELFYRVTVWKDKFNQLVTHEKWRTYLLSQPAIVSCFEGFDECSKILPWNYVIDLFKWKLLLHLLDCKGVPILLGVLWKEELVFDNDVYSWIGVYYLQVNDAENAKFYIDISRYHYEDLYKYYSKLIFFYRISNDKKSFLHLLEHTLHDVGIVVLSGGKYYRFDTTSFVSIERPKDINDITRYINFWIEDTSLLSHKNVSRRDIFSLSFDTISKNYFHHWNFSRKDKIYFHINYE